MPLLRSIEAAEERARQILSQRRLQISTELNGRLERHQEARQKIEEMQAEIRNRKWKDLDNRQSKFEKWSIEKNLAVENSRKLALKAAQLRQAIR